MTFLGIQSWMGFVLTAWGAPGMITRDFANHAVQLYLSRPLSRTEYLLGKASVLAALLPPPPGSTLLLFFLHGKPARERLALEKFLAGRPSLLADCFGSQSSLFTPWHWPSG